MSSPRKRRSRILSRLDLSPNTTSRRIDSRADRLSESYPSSSASSLGMALKCAAVVVVARLLIFCVLVVLRQFPFELVQIDEPLPWRCHVLGAALDAQSLE